MKTKCHSFMVKSWNIPFILGNLLSKPTFSMDRNCRNSSPSLLLPRKVVFWFWSIPKTSKIYGGFHQWGDPNGWMIFHGKSQSKMDELGVPPFHDTSIYGWYPPNMGWFGVRPLGYMRKESIDIVSYCIFYIASYRWRPSKTVLLGVILASPLLVPSWLVTVGVS